MYQIVGLVVLSNDTSWKFKDKDRLHFAVLSRPKALGSPHTRPYGGPGRLRTLGLRDETSNKLSIFLGNGLSYKSSIIFLTSSEYLFIKFSTPHIEYNRIIKYISIRKS